MSYESEVTVLCLFLLIFTFLCGFMPFVIRTSQKYLNLISILGAGMLMGACLIVIIPEGIMTLIASHIKAKI